MLILAQVSDLHADRSERTRRRVAAVTDLLTRMRERLDAVILSGDFADHGREDEYEEVLPLFGLHPHTVFCPGNHDDRGELRRLLGLSGEPLDAINTCVDLPGLRIVACDTSIPGEVEGCLDASTLTWLREEAHEAPDGARILIVIHHTPIAIGSPFLDPIGLKNAGDLARILKDVPQIVGVVCGHAHTAATSTFAGRPVIVAPSVSSTLLFPWEGRGDILDEEAPPGIAYHLIDEASGITTHFRMLTPT